MMQIVKDEVTQTEKLDRNGRIVIPAMQIPQFQTSIAIQNGVETNLLFKTWGGLGDQICSEPALRAAFKYFKGCEISLASEQPTLFQHLPFKNVYDLKRSQPYWEKYFVFDTISPTTSLVWQFFSHCLTNCVDYPSMCAYRSQLPVEDREILLSPKPDCIKDSHWESSIVVHAGRHWASKTFPKDWWDQVLELLANQGLRPVLIGADTDDNRGTVDVSTQGCLDLRNQLSIQESIWVCQRAQVVLTNDSSPLHMAASRDPLHPETGQAWIGYIATCKHPDYITHWRRPPGASKLVWNWREENLGLGGIWDIIDHCPNKKTEVTVEHVEESVLRSWLPSPKQVEAWVLSKLK